MKNRISSLFQLLMLLLMATAVSSCTDEIDYGGPIRPGDSLVTARVNFKDFTPTLSSRSSGTAIKTINTLWIAIYDIDGQLVEKQRITDFTVNMTRPNTRPDGSAQGEEVTGYAEFKFGLKNGRYHIYAIANHDLSNEEIPTEDDLKHIRLTWDETEVSNNAEMFGYFSNKTASADANAVHSFGPETVTINGDTTLHAWVRRAASKLTIVYDGSGLKDNIFVYIKSATIKDIPLACDLGATNMVCTTDSLITDGETLKYYEGDTAPDDNFEYTSDYHYRVTCGGDTVGSHAEVAPALYFYENWQPQGVEGSKDNPSITDKRQDTEGNNKQVSYPNGYKPTDEAWKDGRPYGTYVEIQAYYISTADGNMTRGDIIYRFMLGKDHIANYAAERNYHYRLTMRFNGNANDVDFHIEYYRPKPKLNVAPYYISYLYNHSMLMPISISSGKYKVKKVLAEIKQNRWAPEKAPKDYSIYYNNPNIDDSTNYQWHGFLSLRKTKTTVIPGTDGSYSNTNVNAQYYYGHLRHRREYSDMSPTTEGHIKDMREKDPDSNLGAPSPKSYQEEADDKYYVSLDDHKSDSLVYEVKIPLYTRAKQMIKTNAYTGNNPYAAYQRKAVVTIKVWFDDGDDKCDLEEDVPIYQVRRVVNPKGIYRNSGSDSKPFHVTLRILPGEESKTFKDLVSEGPWKAYVIRGDKSLVSLSKTKGIGGDAVSGKTGSKIDFWVNFADHDGCAIIRVDYHNYSCQHLIFVRKGYAPITLIEDGTKWHTLNLRTKNEETNSPVDEGSLFKYGNLDYPIDATSNVNDETPWINITADKFTWNPEVDTLTFAADNYKTQTYGKLWTEFKAIASTNPFIDGNARKLGGNLKGRIATLADYNALYEHDDIEYGYGVLYGNDATECAADVSVAYGYIYNRSDKAKCGMRGLFVYNKSETSSLGGNNIFFPIGNSGYGYRRPQYKKAWDDPTGKDDKFYKKGGWLKYAIRNGYYPSGDNKARLRPLFYDIWRRPGAIYWLNGVTSKKLEQDTEVQNYLGWDINYFTFDFYGYTTADLFRHEDKDELLKTTDIKPWTQDSGAAFVRLVED